MDQGLLPLASLMDDMVAQLRKADITTKAPLELQHNLTKNAAIVRFVPCWRTNPYPSSFRRGIFMRMDTVEEIFDLLQESLGKGL